MGRRKKGGFPLLALAHKYEGAKEAWIWTNWLLFMGQVAIFTPQVAHLLELVQEVRAGPREGYPGPGKLVFNYPTR